MRICIGENKIRRKKFKERTLSFVLTFVMVLSLFVGMTPVEVYASGETPEPMGIIENLGSQIVTRENGQIKLMFRIQVMTFILLWYVL